MMDGDRPGRYALSLVIFKVLALGYPRSFRARFAGQMQADFLDLISANMRLGPLRGRLVTWRRILADFLRSMPGERGRGTPKKGAARPPHRRNGLGTVWQDWRYALRLWLKSPGFTMVAALTIALGIGATTTIFSIANSLLMRTPTGVVDPATLVEVRVFDMDDQRYSAFSYPMFEDFRAGDHGLAGIAAVDMFPASLITGVDAEPEVISGLIVSGNYFAIVGARPALGRFFAPEEDDAPNAHPVVVLSHRQWRRRFGADSSIVGRTIVLNRTPFTVIGVAQDGFQGHVAIHDVALWVPMAMAGAVTNIPLDSRGYYGLRAIARLGHGSSISEAGAASGLIAARLRSTAQNQQRALDIVLKPYSQIIDEIRGPVAVFIALLFVVSGLVLLIACVNVAGMLLSRASARSREIAVRLAIGAGRKRIVRQLLTESVVLFLLGGGAGVALTFAATDALSSVPLPTPVPMVVDLHPDVRVLGFSLMLALVTGLVFGLAPALQATKPDIVATLKDAGGTPRRNRLRDTFIAAQVAGSAVLLVASGLFLRALTRADEIDLGFNPDGVHVVTMDLSIHRYTADAGRELFRDILERGAALPGVETAAISAVLPLGFTTVSTAFSVAPGEESVEAIRWADINAVSAGYFEVMQIGIVSGRSFGESDGEAAGRVIVVNETAARRFWPGENALGKRLFQGAKEYEVVGIARDGKYRSIGEERRAAVYQVFAQEYSPYASLIVRTGPDSGGMANQLRDAIRTFDRELPFQENAPFSQILGLALLPNKAAGGVAGAFGIVGLALAAIGLYGVLAGAVAQRTREIGIRMALGADRHRLQLRVVAGGFRLIGIGLGVGLPIAAGGGALLGSLLYGLSPFDPVTMAVVAVLFAFVGLVAGLGPARRAIGIDPMVALRHE